MRTKFYLSILAGALLFTGCSKEFLETEPTQFVSKDQIDEAAEKRPEVAAGTLAGLYSLMYTAFSGGTTGHDDFGHKGNDLYSDLLTGDMILGGYTYGWYQDIVEYQSTTDYTDLNNYQVWRFYYKIVFGANNVIDGLGGNDVIPESDEAKFVMGQAKAMRAFAYFYLANFYGEGYDPSAPLLPLYTGLEDAQPLSSTQDVYSLITSDLEDAVTLLEGFNRSAINQINQNVAKGLLAYAYAATGTVENYEKVKSITEELIASGYELGKAEDIVLMRDEEGKAINQDAAGFNDVNTPGWMWGVDLTLDYGLDLVSWWGQTDLFTYSYAWAGDPKVASYDLYDAIPANDVRKGWWVNAYGDGNLYPINKFYAPARTVGGQRNVTTDYVYMRIAEMYLLHAEASFMTGDEPGARDALRTLLDERLDDTAYLDGLTGQALMDEIYLQTRIELWGEGKTYLAVKRLKKSITLPENHLSLSGATYNYNSNELSFEIPQSEIQNNPNIQL